MVYSRRAYANEYSLGLQPPVSSLLTMSHSHSLLPQVTIQDLNEGRSDPGSYGITVYPGSQWTWNCLCLLRVESVSPHPVELLHSGPTSLWYKCSQGSSPQCPTSRHGCLMWGSELWLLLENLCNIITFQFVGCPLAGMAFDYFVKALLLPSCCSLSLDIEYLFW